jgi:hypothetical protein
MEKQCEYKRSKALLVIVITTMTILSIYSAVSVYNIAILRELPHSLKSYVAFFGVLLFPSVIIWHFINREALLEDKLQVSDSHIEFGILKHKKRIKWTHVERVSINSLRTLMYIYVNSNNAPYRNEIPLLKYNIDRQEFVDMIIKKGTEFSFSVD